MPLAFESMSHGTVAFGFFNIDTDMLLLDRYFFFAREFCGCLEEIAEKNPEKPFDTRWDGYTIPDPEDIGDLMGAIHGIRYTGLIGEVYCRFPFPDRPEDFRQKPEGSKTREEIEGIMEKFGTPLQVVLAVGREPDRISIGPYRFTVGVFQELIRYVWLGGYPRWRDGKRPGYVVRMRDKIALSPSDLFTGLDLLP